MHSPDLFAIYSEFIMLKIQDFPGIKIGGHMIYNIRYADDIVLIASSQEHLPIEHLSFQIRERVLQCYVYSILSYGCEIWILSKAVEKRIQATEVWLFQRM